MLKKAEKSLQLTMVNSTSQRFGHQNFDWYCTHIQMHIHAHIQIHTHTHRYTYRYRHTHIQIHIHTQAKHRLAKYHIVHITYSTSQRFGYIFPFNGVSKLLTGTVYTTFIKLAVLLKQHIQNRVVNQFVYVSCQLQGSCCRSPATASGRAWLQTG